MSVASSLLPRLRWWFARRPWLYWLIVAACAAMVWLQVQGAQRSTAEARAAWGRTRRVWVAASDAPAGTPLHAVAREYPEAMVPPAALDETTAGALAAREVAAGAVLVPADVASDSTPPTDWVVFALPVEATPRIDPGNAVALFASGVRACDGIVTAADDATTEVAVPPSCAAAISGAVGERSVVLARTSSGDTGHDHAGQDAAGVPTP